MLVRDLEGSDPSPWPERVAALTECAHRFAGHEWTDKVFFVALQNLSKSGCILFSLRMWQSGRE